jgi:YaiO family outer membrane protein
MKKLILFPAFFVLFCVSVLAQSDPNQTATASDTAKNNDKKAEYEAHFNYSVEHLTKKFGTWRTAALRFQRKAADRQIVWGEYSLSNRNGVRDEEVSGGIYQPLKDKWAFYAEGSYSPTHKFAKKYSVTGEVEKGLKKGVVLHLGGRFSQYEAVKANTVYGIAEKYWGNNRAAYTLYLTNLSNAGTAPNQRFQYNRYYGERVNNFGAAFTIGREHENLGPGIGILRSNTWSVSLSAKHWLTKNIGIGLDGTLHRQGDIYYRRGLAFGLRYRF